VGSGGQNDPRLRLWFDNGHILYLNPSYTSKRHQERSCPPGVAAAASRIECCELPLECWRLFPRSALPNTPTLSPEPPSPRLALSSGRPVQWYHAIYSALPDTALARHRAESGDCSHSDAQSGGTCSAPFRCLVFCAVPLLARQGHRHAGADSPCVTRIRGVLEKKAPVFRPRPKSARASNQRASNVSPAGGTVLVVVRAQATTQRTTALRPQLGARG
jgi:hypothetical protein